MDHVEGSAARAPGRAGRRPTVVTPGSVQGSPGGSLWPPLSVAVREGSRAEHEAAEGSAFVGRLVGGTLRPGEYGAYLLRLHGVYAALEAELAGRSGPQPEVAHLHHPGLERLGAVERDLDVWRPAWRDEPSSSPAVAAYRTRLGEAARRRPLLVAHHYTRYLGDLSGGQVLAQALRRAGHDEGLDLYAFPDLRAGAFKRGYREALDVLPLNGRERAAVVEEVRVAFELNRALLAELG